MNNIPLSYSAARLYCDCKKLFYHTYILKDQPKPSSPAMERGKLVHMKLRESVINKTYPKGIFVPTGYLEWIWEHKGKAEVSLALSNSLDWMEFFDNSCYVRGKIDVVVLNDKIHIIDWKTGFPKWDEIQRNFTHLLVTKGMDKDIMFHWVWVDSGETEVQKSTKEDSEKAIELIEKIRNETDFSPWASWRCNFCGVNDCNFNRKSGNKKSPQFQF